MKKRITCLALALIAILGFAGCDKDKSSSSVASSSAASSSAASSSATGSSSAASSSTTGSSSAASSSTASSTSADINVFTKTETPHDWTETQTLDVCLNYYSSKMSMGITYQQANSYTNLDGVTYSKGDLLPTWKQFAKDLNIKFNDVADYAQTSNNLQHTAIYEQPASGTKFVTSSGANVDIYFNSASNMTAAATDGNLVDLNAYLSKMPNLREFFRCNKDIYKQLQTSDGSVFIAPYFDGKDAIEKMFIMNTEMIEKLLDAANPTYDTTTTIPTAYEPQINYGANEKIAVVDANAQAGEITVNVAKNIIDIQNDLTTKNGATLTEAFKTYLTATYGSYVGNGKLYSNYSEIFTSASACYNVDEMVALMRCVKANPQYLTGTDTINVLFPRQTNANNRVENIMQFASAFGVQGLAGEKDRLYFDAEGNLKDARTTEKSYDALDLLHNLYTEGLIVSDFYTTDATTKYSEISFTAGTGFMVYDYNATNSVYNATDENGNGTAGSLSTKIKPVLSPVTYWENDDHTTYTYTRHSEDTRSVKDGGWCIPKNTDSLDAALALFDYIYGYGSDLQDYGTEDFTDGTLTVAGETYPAISKEVFAAISASGYGWNNWYRIYVGATEGLGHVRSNGLDYQVTHLSGREGLANIKTAIACGVMSLALTYGDNGFNKAVNTYWTLTSAQITEATKNISDLTTFWAQQAGLTGQNKVIVSGWDAGQEEGLKTLFSTSDTEYLARYALSLN